ncbi:hypothetical protein [Methylobacterium radiodurans]|uniref:Uncharacterized protein n=1 Tax=Methylobacterium radiodurans TaxID=2202828 RepID=A0A2U8VTD0_9HYPH|nr:hypothetical protein [Methylobacterium radiodurans]AWN36522.1 hypothetical protein DK427_12940 [Methylobacterium radiodurans]
MTMIIAVPSHVIDTAVSAVLSATPRRRRLTLAGQSAAFIANLSEQGFPDQVARGYGISFERAVLARVEAAGGGLQ